MKRLILQFLPVLFLISCSSVPFEVVEEVYDNGSPKIIRYYKNETKEILVREVQYYADSIKYMEGSFKNGMRDGIWTAWHRNGNVWSTGKYKGGKENGRKTVYHENGQKYYEGTITDEKRKGTWTFWNLEGEVVKRIDYDQK